MEVQEKRKQVKVVATKAGYDGVQLRQPGEEFYVSEAYFDQRVQTKARHYLDDEGNKQVEPPIYHRPPSWFERVEEKAAAPEGNGKKKGGGGGGNNADGLT